MATNPFASTDLLLPYFGESSELITQSRYSSYERQEIDAAKHPN